MELKSSGLGVRVPLAPESSHSPPLTLLLPQPHPYLIPFAFAASMGRDTEAQDRTIGQQRVATSPSLVHKS